MELLDVSISVDRTSLVPHCKRPAWSEKLGERSQSSVGVHQSKGLGGIRQVCAVIGVTVCSIFSLTHSKRHIVEAGESLGCDFHVELAQIICEKMLESSCQNFGDISWAGADVMDHVPLTIVGFMIVPYLRLEVVEGVIGLDSDIGGPVEFGASFEVVVVETHDGRG